MLASPQSPFACPRSYTRLSFSRPPSHLRSNLKPSDLHHLPPHLPLSVSESLPAPGCGFLIPTWLMINFHIPVRPHLLPFQYSSRLSLSLSLEPFPPSCRGSSRVREFRRFGTPSQSFSSKPAFSPFHERISFCYQETAQRLAHNNEFNILFLSSNFPTSSCLSNW